MTQTKEQLLMEGHLISKSFHIWLIYFMEAVEKWKQWLTLFFWAPKSLWMVMAAMKLEDACFLEGNLNSILKSKDIALSTNVHIVKAMVFPVVMYGCEIWTIKKAEHRRTDAFEL